jgi:hypothetical protein
MDDKEILERVREAIACLDEAQLDLPLNTRDQRKLHTRIQDAGDRLVEVREEIQVRLQAAENADRLFTRGI